MAFDAQVQAPWGTAEAASLKRSLNWTHAFWFAAGAPALVLFSLGAISATTGTVAVAVWTVSVLCGFLQTFTYAEISGMFPHKSGGASVYGAVAWVRYGKMLGPISVWSNWFSWSPVMAIGVGLAAGYITNFLFPADAFIRTWEVTLLDLGWLQNGLRLRIDGVYMIGWALVLMIFAIQHRGILNAANVQKWLAIIALAPLFIVSILPILTGGLNPANFTPFVPLAAGPDGAPTAGEWNLPGWTVFVGGLFIASYSTYAFETAVCYTREFKDPGRDTPRAIIAAGLLSILVFSLVPLSFQGVLGLDGLLNDDILSGMGVGDALARMVGGGPVVYGVITTLLIGTLLLSVSTAMAGSSRTLYQGSVDGWLPRYLAHVNDNGAPTRAMWTDLLFNMVLLMFSDYLFLLAIANVNYLIFVFLNLQSGWIHRIDSPDVPRPYRAPNWLLATGAILGFWNMFMMGMGANIVGANTLIAGLIVAVMIVPVFWFRHYVQDRGKFPEQLDNDMRVTGLDGVSVRPRAGVLPYLALAGGLALMWLGYFVGS